MEERPSPVLIGSVIFNLQVWSLQGEYGSNSFRALLVETYRLRHLSLKAILTPIGKAD
jgi:hypothetical protein